MENSLKAAAYTSGAMFAERGGLALHCPRDAYLPESWRPEDRLEFRQHWLDGHRAMRSAISQAADDAAAELGISADKAPPKKKRAAA